MTYSIEKNENAPLWEATKTACQYLDSLNEHDLRRLTKEKLIMFSSIIVGKFAEERAKQVDLNDDIPF
tara:strand:+ start:249 stop:452 length:204 start_codon:yes stop_codon:yes gene_type:complete